MDYQARIVPTRDILRRMPAGAASDADIAGIELMLSLVAAADGLRERAMAPLAHEGISDGKFSLLMALFGEGPMGTTKLSQRIGVKAATVSVMVKRMLTDADPLISVKTGCDRRERLISLTAAGRAKVTECLPGHLAVLRSVSSKFTADERETLLALLKKLQ